MADDKGLVAKPEQLERGSSESIESSPEPEGGPPDTFPQEATQKRKGGRKPIYATSEERKQRNRQAQAAFRERRTEYIKQLEATIKHHEEALHTLQQSHRTAADECLMLRYKNSLLERILLEKGIDVQAELRAKTGSPHLGPTHVSPAPAPTQNATMQQAIMNRHNQNHARRSGSGMLPKLEPPSHTSIPQQAAFPTSAASPLHPTPPSQKSSPATAISPAFGPQGVMTPPASDRQAQPQPQQGQRLQQPPRSQVQAHRGFAVPSTMPVEVQTSFMPAPRGSGASFYTQTPFQSHMDQLEQEYDAQADMLDDEPSDHSAGPGPFTHGFPPARTSVPQNMGPYGLPQQHPPPLPQPPQPPPHQTSQSHVPNINPHGYRTGQTNFDPYDPALDADPFGLSASMTFPTPFNFDGSSMR